MKIEHALKFFLILWMAAIFLPNGISASEKDAFIVEKLSEAVPFSAVTEGAFKMLGQDLVLPDGGYTVKNLAVNAAGGAFDPRDLEKVAPETLGYKARWVVVRYPYYNLDWDITGLKLESLNPKAKTIPWLVIMNGGSANVYEFFLDPLNNPGLGQYLAQSVNVLIVTIPGNFKYGGWSDGSAQRSPQYLLDKDLSAEEVKVRNAIYTNKMEIEGIKRLILQETSGDILIVGHSTSGELTFLSMGETQLSDRLKGRFLGWGSGGPSNLRKEWEEKVGKREESIQELSKYPPLWEMRTRNAKGYVNSGYIGPLNPLREPGMQDLDIAQRWLSLVEKRRPNIKQVLQDMEHRGMVELKDKLEKEIRETLAHTSLPVKVGDVLADMFATNQTPLTGYQKMVWVAAKWDKGHWNKKDDKKARELTIADQFQEKNPGSEIRILLFDLPMTHYGHIEMPRQVAGGLIAATQWLVK